VRQSLLRRLADEFRRSSERNSPRSASERSGPGRPAPER
jgi:hypothetical protein